MGVFIVGFVTIIGIIILIINLCKNNKSKEKEWHYLQVNRGRYLCLMHGGFCDSSDGYTKECPICNKGDKKNWQLNPVDVSLQIVRNLQGRSMKRISIISGATGLFGVFSFFERDKFVLYLKDIDPDSKYFLNVFVILFILSFLCYLVSMNHIKTTKFELGKIYITSKFSVKTISEWETYMAWRLNMFEWFHKFGNILFFLSGIYLIRFILTQFF